MSAMKNGIKKAKNDLWEKYRPKPINFSDVAEDGTIYESNDTSNERTAPSPSQLSLTNSRVPLKHTFEPNEITGRSTECLAMQGLRQVLDVDPEAISVEDLVNDSFVEQIRNMSQFNYDESVRISLPNRYSASNAMARKDFPWNQQISNVDQSMESLLNENFMPAEEMHSVLLHDEKAWEKEFANLPPAEPDMNIAQASSTPNVMKKVPGKLVNLTEFSGFLGDVNSSTDVSKMSMGRFFHNRCEDIRHMIPNKSPTKDKPVPLIESYRSDTDANTSAETHQYSQISSSFYTDDELKIKSLPRVNNATYDKKGSKQLSQSIMSVSSIAAQLSDVTHDDSPRTLLNKLYVKRSNRPLKSVLTANSKNVNSQANANEYQTDDDEETGIGMLARMDSTNINEKENRWRQNDSADTESLNESAIDLTNTSIASCCSSLLPVAQKLPPPPPLQNNAVVMTNKRMRSKSPSPSPSPVIEDNVDIPTNQFGFYSPQHEESKASAQATNSSRTDDHQRQYALNSRSPDATKFSLPNYGLRSGRSMSYSPNGAVLVARSSSQCSTNSEFTQKDGQFPLKASKSELTWECVKLRKIVTKSLIIKNTAEKKLSLRMEVCGPGFQIESGADKASIVLQGNECRTIYVTFCPTVLGKAIGKLTFRPTKNWPEDTERDIQLWAYGGSTALQVLGIERAPVGIAFLKMGETSEIRSTTLQRSFSIYNKGPLYGFATIFVKAKSNQYITETHINIEPNKCVIRPDSSANVSVTYKLRRKDLEKLQKASDVLTVATLEVIIGAEPNRQRIASMLTRNSNVPTSYSQLNFLANGFPAINREDFSDFREDMRNISDLFSCFKTSEIALTINRTTLDETRDNYSNLSGMEETILFRTLVENPTSYKATCDRMWSVLPNRLTMDTLMNARKTLTIHSFFNKDQTFQIESNYSNLFNFSRTSGRIPANSEYQFEIGLKSGAQIPSEAVLIVYIESDCIEVPVHIQQSPFLRLN